MRKTRRLQAVLCGVLCAALLSGCGGMFSLDDMLRAPQLTGEYSAVQTALNDHLNESAQLKYPNSGEFLSPFLFGDWDGDGVQDAAVLFVSSGSANAQLAVLQTDEDGSWQVRDVAEGLSDSVDTVRFAALQQNGADQILVGYTTPGDKYLAAYAYKDGRLEAVLQQPYTQYIVEDLTGSGTDNLVLLASDAEGQTQVQMLVEGPEGFSLMQVIGLSAEQFSGYASLAAGVGQYGGNYLILDGYTGAAGNYLASSVLQYNMTTGQMNAASLPGTKDIYESSLRYAACLTSRDLDGDGIVEIPTQGEEAGTLNLTQNKRYSFVRWMDFTRTRSEKSFGIVDEEYGFYLALPEEWEGNIQMVDDGDGGVALYNMAGDVQYLRLRLTAELGPAEGWARVGSVSSRQLQVQLAEGAGSVSVYQLARGFYLL